MWKTRKYSKKKRGKNFIDIGVRTLQNMADGISIYSQQEKNTDVGMCVHAHLCIHKCFTQQTLIKIWTVKIGKGKGKKERTVTTLEISHNTEKTNKNIKEKGEIATKIVLKLNNRTETRSPTITSKPE